jgi:hypothetical protein
VTVVILAPQPDEEVDEVGCPECGGVKARVIYKGMDGAGRPLRDYRCADCHTYYSTAEVRIPVRMYVLDEKRKERNRLGMRERRGGLMGRYRRVSLRPTPELRISVEVVTPR